MEAQLLTKILAETDIKTAEKEISNKFPNYIFHISNSGHVEIFNEKGKRLVKHLKTK